MHWHVDDLEGTVQRLLCPGRRRSTSRSPRAGEGFVTASVVDPFGNVLGVMYNPHYVEMVGVRPDGVTCDPARVPRRRRLGVLVGRAPRGRLRGVAADRQARLRRRDHRHRRRAGRGAVLGLDRRSAQGLSTSVSFQQRYCPRRPRSSWSQINVAKVEALTAAGRMRPPGLAEVAAAQADGRWAAAYASQRTAEVPPDLAAALAGEPPRRRRVRGPRSVRAVPGDPGAAQDADRKGAYAGLARAIERLEG